MENTSKIHQNRVEVKLEINSGPIKNTNNLIEKGTLKTRLASRTTYIQNHDLVTNFFIVVSPNETVAYPRTRSQSRLEQISNGSYKDFTKQIEVQEK